MYSGRPEEAIELVKKAMRLSPYYPAWYLAVLGNAYRLKGQYEEAITLLESWRARANPRSALPHLLLAFTYEEAGRGEEAQVSVAEVLKRKPKASIAGYLKANTFPYKDPADIERVIDSLRKAGLPDKPPLSLPDKPSIAVLPFVNMSDDPKQEYFSDGLTDQIINGLSKVSNLFVIARNSTFTYKGKPVKVQKVAEDLGVKYVLEGSVQKTADRIRITAQLIDATTGHHLWSERYDRDPEDIFAVQDDITMEIMKAMQVKLSGGEQARVWARGTENLEAYMKVLQALENIYQINIESNARARQLAEEAIALDPEYSSAYLLLSITHMMDVLYGSSKSPRDSMARSMELTQKSLALDDSSADAHSQLGFLYTMTRQHDKGIAEAERAVALNPNNANAYNRLGLALRFAGRPEEAVPVIRKSIRLNPFPPGATYYNLGMAYLYTGQCEESIAACEKALQRENDNLFAHVTATVAYNMCGREEEARATAADVSRINPKFSLEYFAKRLPYKNQADTDRYIAALRKAGLK
jgi:adenylate cyclase